MIHGVLNKVLYKEALPWGPTTYFCIYIVPFLAENVHLLYIFFWQINGTPFLYLHVVKSLASLLLPQKHYMLNMDKS